MDRKDIQDLVTKAIRQIQEVSGREIPENLTGDTCPLRDLDGFESICGVELCIILSKTIPLPLDFNPCVSEDGKRALRTREIVDRVQAIAGAQEREGDE